MVNPQKIKGSSYERSIVNYLKDNGFADAERTRAGWADDRGDIHGVKSQDGTPFTFECKNHRGDSLPGWTKELEREVSNAKGLVGVVVHKRHGTTDPGEQFASMPLAMLVQLIKQAGYK